MCSLSFPLLQEETVEIKLCSCIFNNVVYNRLSFFFSVGNILLFVKDMEKYCVVLRKKKG